MWRLQRSMGYWLHLPQMQDSREDCSIRRRNSSYALSLMYEVGWGWYSQQKFYWAGMKLIPANRREVLKIQERVKSGGAPMTWREHRFIVTNKSDLFKFVTTSLSLRIINLSRISLRSDWCRSSWLLLSSRRLYLLSWCMHPGCCLLPVCSHRKELA